MIIKHTGGRLTLFRQKMELEGHRNEITKKLRAMSVEEGKEGEKWRKAKKTLIMKKPIAFRGGSKETVPLVGEKISCPHV